jgi:prefoldin subunit 5
MQPIELMMSVGIDNYLDGCMFAKFLAEFAFEIGSGLLTEVRRLQSLLAERDKAIQDMKEEKDDLEKSVESLRTALRQQEQSSGAPAFTNVPNRH